MDRGQDSPCGSSPILLNRAEFGPANLALFTRFPTFRGNNINQSQVCRAKFVDVLRAWLYFVTFRSVQGASSSHTRRVHLHARFCAGSIEPRGVRGFLLSAGSSPHPIFLDDLESSDYFAKERQQGCFGILSRGAVGSDATGVKPEPET